MIITDNLGLLLTKTLFEWLKDKTMLIYLAIASIVTIFVGLVSIVSVIDAFNQLAKIMPELLVSKTVPPELMFKVIINLFPALIPSMVMSIVAGIIFFVLNYFIIQRGLELNKQKSVPFSISRLIMVFFLEIITFFVAVLSIYRLKWLAIGLCGFLFVIIGALLSQSFFGGFFAFIGILMMIAYFIIVCINYIRLSLGAVAYIEKEREIMESLKVSWDLTKNNVLGIIIISLAVSLIVGFISYLVSTPSSLLLQLAIPELINIKDTISFGILFEGMAGVFSNPLYIILLIPVWIISAYQIIVMSYLLPSIYALLKKEGKTTEKQETYHF